jgi:hypothetical protein
MKKIVKIFLLHFLVILPSNIVFATGNTVSATDNIVTADTVISQTSSEKIQDKAGTANKQKANIDKQQDNQPVKQIKGARPDMSKARGARPAYIQRQSGSGIPRGIGRPGGAGGIKPGKR